MADTYDAEKPKVAASARNAPSIKAQAQQAKDTVSAQANGQAGGSSDSYGAHQL